MFSKNILKNSIILSRHLWRLAAILLTAFIISGPASVEADEPQCGDFLAQTGKKPPGLEFISCGTTQEFNLKVLSAEYRVPGGQAEAVEEFFMKEAGMGPLVFLCCGWEIKGYQPGYIEHNQKWTDPDIEKRYVIRMGSGETFHYPRELWAEKMDWFYVEAILYLESP